MGLADPTSQAGCEGAKPSLSCRYIYVLYYTQYTLWRYFHELLANNSLYIYYLSRIASTPCVHTPISPWLLLKLIGA